MIQNRQLTEAISWRLVTELWRCFPEHFHLIEAHPGGGQNDCLTLVRRAKSGDWLLSVNRGGSLHFHATSPNIMSWSDWLERMLNDPKFLDEVTRTLGFEPPKKLPPSTAATVVFRFIADFLTHSIGRLEKWECRNGFEDTSGWGGGKREKLFAQFPAIASSPVPRLGDYSNLYGYWFLVRDGEPKVCLTTDGLAFTKSGQTLFDLMALYQEHRRIWPLIHVVAGNLLP